MKKFKSLLPLLLIFSIACNSINNKEIKMQQETFGNDLDFLRKHHKNLILLEEGDARLIVLPDYQGRVMTSTAEGDEGMSFGWINHELVASGKFTEHFSAFGGEDRLWLGPEGGQYSIYFKKGVDFTFDNWFVPREIDTEPFDVLATSKTEASFQKRMHLENYSGTAFDLMINRKIRLMSNAEIELLLKGAIQQDVKVVGFESENIITNEGKNQWDKSTGLLSLWVLSMLRADDSTTVFIPYRKGDSTALGKVLTDDYFGKVPSERLKVDSGLIRFKADGKLRSKIGISPLRTVPMAASYDARNRVLTIALFSFDPIQQDYVNSLWKIQEDPYSGDVVNAYNDGPVDGKQMGKFYEIESSSPAAALAPGQQLVHTHKTIHLKGKPEDLEHITNALFGVKLDQVVLK